jgi:addiction module HigA family antidote
MSIKPLAPKAKRVVGPGEHLRHEIKRRGLDQTTLSQAIAVSRQSINNIISGRQLISRKMALKLAKKMRQPSDYWLRDKYPAPAVDPPKTDLLKSSEVKPARRKPRPWERRTQKVKTFRAFVLKLSAADISNKELISGIKADRGFPSVNTWADLRFHLNRLGATEEHFVAGRALWRKYDAEVKSK